MGRGNIQPWAVFGKCKSKSTSRAVASINNRTATGEEVYFPEKDTSHVLYFNNSEEELMSDSEDSLKDYETSSGSDSEGESGRDREVPAYWKRIGRRARANAERERERERERGSKELCGDESSDGSTTNNAAKKSDPPKFPALDPHGGDACGEALKSPCTAVKGQCLTCQQPTTGRAIFCRRCSNRRRNARKNERRKAKRRAARAARRCPCGGELSRLKQKFCDQCSRNRRIDQARKRRSENRAEIMRARACFEQIYKRMKWTKSSN